MSERTPLTEAERAAELSMHIRNYLTEYTDISTPGLHATALTHVLLAARTSTATADTGLRERVEAKMRDCLRLSGTAMDPDVREWTLAFGKDLRAILDATAAPTTDTGARDE